MLPYRDLTFSAHEYFDAIDRFGSPAYSPEQIADASEQARLAADRVLVRATGVTVGRPADRPDRTTPPIAPSATLNATVHRDGSCVRLSADDHGPYYAAFSLPAGGISYEGESAPVATMLGRFADPPAVPLPSVVPAGTISPPTDGYRGTLAGELPDERAGGVLPGAGA